MKRKKKSLPTEDVVVETNEYISRPSFYLARRELLSDINIIYTCVYVEIVNNTMCQGRTRNTKVITNDTIVFISFHFTE